jgi:hypothetical protein
MEFPQGTSQMIVMLENIPDIEGFDSEWIPGVNEWKFSWECPHCSFPNRDYEGPTSCYRCDFVGSLSGPVGPKFPPRPQAFIIHEHQSS